MGFVIVEPIIEAFIPKKTKIVFNSQIRLAIQSQKCSARLDWLKVNRFLRLMQQ
jgi:hypothetical protein